MKQPFWRISLGTGKWNDHCESQMNCPAEETGQEDTASPQRTDDFVSSDAGPAGTAPI
jgi:hypothetical protein